MICVMSSFFHEFNFKMLRAIVEEMNRYTETPAQVLKMLNIDPASERRCAYDTYSVKLTIWGRKVETHVKSWRGNLQGTIQIPYTVTNSSELIKQQKYRSGNTVGKIECATFKFADLKHVHFGIGEYVFVNSCEQHLILCKR